MDEKQIMNENKNKNENNTLQEKNNSHINNYDFDSDIVNLKTQKENN